MWLLIGDTHFTDNARDSSRFGIFDWIKKRQAKTKPLATFFAGDLADAKDRHSATLVNKIVAGLTSLKPPVYIVMGNHDYRDAKNPFFKFLSHIDGIHFVTEPTVVKAGKRMALIPHYRTQDEFTAGVKLACADRPDSFLCHQTFDGAIAETGVRLSGLSASPIESFDPPLGVYAGDVHRPQTQGLVTYIGCPYQVRFGDNFEPRCIEVSPDGTEAYPWFDAPRKWSLTVRDAANLTSNKELVEGDQVKLTINLAREEAVEWQRIRKEVLSACKELRLEVHGVKLEISTATRRKRLKLDEQHESNSVGTFDQFCKAENVAGSIKKVGKGILDGNKNIL
jgi:predicted phosphodiesterase